MKRLYELKSTVKGLDGRGMQWKLTDHAIIYLTIAWAIDSEAMRARGIIDKTTLTSKTRFSRHFFGFQSRRFWLLGGFNI